MDTTAPPARTRLTAAQRRELILQAATEIFAAAGYRAGKVADVAALVGVTEPVVFQNFGSKAALYAAVLDRAIRGIGDEVRALTAHHGSAASLLAHLLSPGPANPEHYAGKHHLLFTDAAILAADPAAGEPARRAARALADHLASLIRQGQAEGSIAADTAPEAAAWLLLSVLSTRPLRAVAMSGPAHLETAVIDLALRAVAGD